MMAVYVVYFENAGAPATGLTPTFATLQDLVPVAVAAPAVTEVGGGFYTFTLVPSVDLLVVLDGGAGLPAGDRYLNAMLTPRDSNPSFISKLSVPAGGAFADLDGGNGVRQITLTIDDGTDPILNAKVSVFVASTSTYVASAVTPANGQVVFALNDGSYDIRVFAPGYTFTVPTVLAVTATASSAISGVSAVPAAPVDPTLCRVYLDAIKFDGTARFNTRVTVTNMYTNPIQGRAVVDGEQVFNSGSASGRVEFDLPRGGKFRVSIQDGPIGKEITVPDLATQELTVLLGSPQDSFTVIPA